MIDLGISTEEWRTVEGYDGIYEVSNLARVRSLSRFISRRHNGVIIQQPVAGRILSQNWLGRYLRVTLSKNGVSTEHPVHHLVCAAFNGKRPLNKQCAHRDDNPINNLPDNLYWATKLENEADKKLNGGWVYGTRNGFSKANPEIVRSIRALSRSGWSQRMIAAEVGLAQSAVWKILNGVTWGHVDDVPAITGSGASGCSSNSSQEAEGG